MFARRSFTLVTTNKSAVDWYNFCRDICLNIIKLDNKKIGGPGHIVEIDESKFGKQKFRRGRPVNGKWVLGGIDWDTGETFFKVVEDRSAETLLPILIDNIHPDSIVISDCWKSYNSVSKHFKEHSSVIIRFTLWIRTTRRFIQTQLNPSGECLNGTFCQKTELIKAFILVTLPFTA